MAVGGDPAVVNDVGNDRLSDGKDLRTALGRCGRSSAMPASATGRAGVGRGVEAQWEAALTAMGRFVDNAAETLEEDGYHLQRASTEIDTAMNQCRPAGGGPGAMRPV